MNGKMNLSGAPMSDVGRHTPNNATKKQTVQIVQPRPKGMGAVGGVSEPIVGCCKSSELKMAGKK